MPSDIVTYAEINRIDQMYKRILIGSKLHFLIIDDSNTSCTMVERIIRGLKFSSIYTAKNGQDGIAQLNTIPDPVVILLDINMPIMDGITFLERTQAELKSRDIIVFIMSTNKRKGIVLKCVELGAKGYLCKPFTAKQLEEKINSVFSNM